MARYSSKDNQGYRAIYGVLMATIREGMDRGSPAQQVQNNLSQPQAAGAPAAYLETITTRNDPGDACEQPPATPQSAALPPLLVAAASPSTVALESVLRNTPDVNITENGRFKRNALHFAAISNQPRNVSLLLRAGVDINAAAEGGITPIFLACMEGYAEVVRVLIEEGRDRKSVV